MARKAKVKTPTMTVKTTEAVTMNENTVESVEAPKMAYSDLYKGRRRATTNIPVYKAAGDKEMCGVLANGKKAELTGNYVEVDGIVYVEMKNAKVCGFVKDLKYLR